MKARKSGFARRRVGTASEASVVPKSKKSKKLYEAIGLIGDDTIAEVESLATPAAPPKRRSAMWQAAPAAAAAVVLSVVTAILFQIYRAEPPVEAGQGTCATTDGGEVTTPPNTRRVLYLDEPGNQAIEELSSERIAQMLIDYAEFTGNREGYDPADIDPDTLYLNGHFGTFNGNDVVSIWAEGRPGTADVKGYSIEGYHIARLSSGSMSVVVYTGSTFVCVYDAYEQGLLTYENVRAMGFYRIRESYVWNLGHDGFNYVGTDVTFDDVVIYEYYEPNKNYWYRDSGLFVAMGFRDAPESARQVQVAGYTFDLPLGSRDIYAPFGWVRSIAEDYESGWLSRTQLSVLYGTHFNRDYPIPGEVQSNGEFLYRYNPWVSGLEILDFDHDSWEHGNAYMASDFRIDIPAQIDGVPVRGIAEGAFSGWTPSSPTVAVILPEGLTHIGVRSFNFYTNTLPNSPTWSPVIIPDSVIFIGELAFGHNLGLTVIHRGVTYQAVRGSHRSGEMPQAFYDAVNSPQ